MCSYIHTVLFSISAICPVMWIVGWTTCDNRPCIGKVTFKGHLTNAWPIITNQEVPLKVACNIAGHRR